MERGRANEKKHTGEDYLSFCILQYNGLSCQTNIPYERHIAWHQTNIGTEFINALAY